MKRKSKQIKEKNDKMVEILKKSLEFENLNNLTLQTYINCYKILMSGDLSSNCGIIINKDSDYYLWTQFGLILLKKTNTKLEIGKVINIMISGVFISKKIVDIMCWEDFDYYFTLLKESGVF